MDFHYIEKAFVLTGFRSDGTTPNLGNDRTQHAPVYRLVTGKLV